MTDQAAKERAAAEQVAGIDMPVAGEEPAFLPHPLLDALLEAVVALGGELWIERDRRRALEAVLAEKNLLSPDDIEGWQPSPEQAAERAADLKAMTDRVLKSLRALGADQDSL